MNNCTKCTIVTSDKALYGCLKELILSNFIKSSVPIPYNGWDSVWFQGLLCINQNLMCLKCSSRYIIASVQAWTPYHQRKLYYDKKEFLVISSKYQLKHLQICHHMIGNQIISPSPAAKSLGVIVNAHLSVNFHITSICRSAYYHLVLIPNKLL